MSGLQLAEEPYTTTRNGELQTVWTIHHSPVAETGTGPWGELEYKWTLRVYSDGTVETSRSIPYSGQRRYSTEDRPNKPEKTSQFRLSVEKVIKRHARACADAGAPISGAGLDDFVVALRKRVLAVLRRDDVETNGELNVDLLAGGV